MKKSDLRNIIREEVQEVVSEVDYALIEEKLQEVYDTLAENNAFTALSVATASQTRRGNRAYTKLALETVSRLTEIPMNHLMLYFINQGRTINENESMIECRQQIVYFFKNLSGDNV